MEQQRKRRLQRGILREHVVRRVQPGLRERRADLADADDDGHQDRGAHRGEDLDVDAEIREALVEPISTIINAIKVALENTPPELAGDIIDCGMVLTGGGSLLRGMDVRLREETGLPIITVDDPLTSVVLGVGKILDELDLLRKVSVMSQYSGSR